MVETMNEEEEVETAGKRRHPNRKRHKTTRYEPIFQGKQYKYYSGVVILNCGEILGFKIT